MEMYWKKPKENHWTVSSSMEFSKTKEHVGKWVLKEKQRKLGSQIGGLGGKGRGRREGVTAFAQVRRRDFSSF